MRTLVTGGASGLGEAITRKLASISDCHVFFTYCKSKAASQAITQSLGNCTAWHCDFSDAESVESLLAMMQGEGLTALVNNALTGATVDYFHKLLPDSFLGSFAANVAPVVKITHRAIDIFRKQKSGRIVTVLSTACVGSPPMGWSQYAAEKAYLAALSRSWAVENARYGITSNCVSPSFMRTSLTRSVDERVVEELTRSHPRKELLKVGEVADVVAFLLTSSQQINGANIVIGSTPQSGSFPGRASG